MAVKQMRFDDGFCHAGGYRGPLEVMHGYVVRLVIAGTPTMYVYGAYGGQRAQTFQVYEVEDTQTREQIRQLLADWKQLALDDVVWVAF